MGLFSIVVNNTLKEYWVAEPKYIDKLDRIIEVYKGIFDITFYTSNNVDEDIKTEELRGYKKVSHYSDWTIKHNPDLQ